jgi:hypothetical protein
MDDAYEGGTAMTNPTSGEHGTSITGVTVKLIGEDGNAFSILGRVHAAMRDAGVPAEVIEQYRDDATSGDYDHLLAVTMEYVEVV